MYMNSSLYCANTPPKNKRKVRSSKRISRCVWLCQKSR